MPKSSAPFLSLRVVALLSLPVLAACTSDDLGLPKVFGLEVPQEVLDQPQVVPKADVAQDDQGDYPLLGNVPSKPKDFTPQATIDAAKSEMEKDRSQALSIEQKTQPIPPAK